MGDDDDDDYDEWDDGDYAAADDDMGEHRVYL